MKRRLLAGPAGFSVLLVLCLLLSAQHILSNAAGLGRNLTLTKLWKAVAYLSPPRAEELIGLQQRPRRELSAEEMKLLMSLDGLRVSPAAILALVGQPIEAQSWLQSHATANSLDRYWLALAIGQRHQADAAIQMLRDLNGTNRYFAMAGFRAQNSGRFEEASRLLAAAASLDDGHFQDRSVVYEYLTKNAYNHERDWDKSLYWAERWIQAVPDDTYAYTWLAALHLWRGQPEQAFAVLESGKPYGVQSNPGYSGQMGLVYQARGDWNLAIENYRKSWELNKDISYMRPHVAWNLGFALFHENQWDEARPYLQIAAQSGVQPATDILKQMEAGRSQ